MFATRQWCCTAVGSCANPLWFLMVWTNSRWGERPGQSCQYTLYILASISPVMITVTVVVFVLYLTHVNHLIFYLGIIHNWNCDDYCGQDWQLYPTWTQWRCKATEFIKHHNIYINWPIDDKHRYYNNTVNRCWRQELLFLIAFQVINDCYGLSAPYDRCAMCSLCERLVPIGFSWLLHSAQTVMWPLSL